MSGSSTSATEAPTSPDHVVVAEPKKAQKEIDLERMVAVAKTTDPKNGLTAAQVASLRETWGLNELPDKTVNPFLLFLSYFTGPMPTMIWVAIIVELVKAILVGEGWEDFAVLMVLQFANATVGFIEENNAGNAIAALKNALKPFAYACRDGAWSQIAARELVPGDLILLKLGDVIPADSILMEGHGPLQVDQAALTGESLPVNVHPWGRLLMGAAIKRGESHAVVVDTGMNTFFGKAAGLIAQVVTQGHLQKVLLNITIGLLVLSLILCAVIFGVLMTTRDLEGNIVEGGGKGKVMSSLSVVIVILVASIPIAIEVVCTSTLAVGSHTMAEKKVIVARLSAIEELAGMTILCSDKTGTLTQNKLGLREPILLGTYTEQENIFYAALASKRDKGAQDAIDLCITNALTPENLTKLEGYTQLHFEPFNPTDKRTVAQVTTPDGSFIEVTKGAPHIILHMSHNAKDIKAKVEGSVQELADRGFRALGVAINKAGKDVPAKWEYVGILSLFDPPRHDTKATIAAAIDNGIEVKMVTGDHTAIAKETCRELGMGTSILNTEVLNNADVPQETIDKIILEAHGFAEVMPEHKFMIVARLREQGHVTGMTGDGVNDAPALKRADVGIAVEGATDAARAAADLVLIEPGLAVIIDAIFLARCIFQRMRNYIIYRIACTIQLLCFFFFACLTVLPNDPFMYGTTVFEGDAEHAASFTLPVIALVIITILNDGCMITISHDRVIPEKKPQTWDMQEMVFIALVLGFVACVSSLLLLAFCMHANITHPGNALGLMFGQHGKDYITWHDLRTILYLKVSISDFLTLFSARTRGWFFELPPGRLLGGAAVIALTCSTLFSLFWDRMFEALPGAFMGGLRNSNGAAIATWIYCIIWFLVQDVCKMAAYFLWDMYYVDPKKHKIETFARRHSLQLREAAQGANLKMDGDLLPNGVDLTQIALDAATESVRLRNVAAEAKAKAAAHGGRGRLAEIAAGERAASAKPAPAASEADAEARAFSTDPAPAAAEVAVAPAVAAE